MKKIFSFILIFSTLTIAASAVPLLSSNIEITSPSAILMEKETGEIIYEKNSHERMAPASVTKIMTMLLIIEAIDNNNIDLQSIVTASKRASTFGGSCIYLEENEKMSVEDMLKCICVVSANDCSVAMAEYISGTEQAFVEKMNKRANELGLTDTHFTNCTGLFDDPNHYTSAYDIAIISRELIKHDLIKSFSTIWIDSIRNGEFTLNNTNKLVYYYEGCTGLKTGYTNNAMYCISATAMREDVEYIAVIMHSETIDSRNTDAKNLLNFGFSNYTLCHLKANYPLSPVLVTLGKSESVQPTYSKTGAILIPKQQSSNIRYNLDMSTSILAPVNIGDKLGKMTITLEDGNIIEVPIIASNKVDRITVYELCLKLLKLYVGSE